MSPLSPDHIRIGLGASYAVLASLDRSTVMQWRMQTWTPMETDTPWQQALATVSDWLAELKPRGKRIGLALSSELAPLCLLPWREDVIQADRQGLLAADHFRRVYGETAQHWKTVVQPTGYGQPWLAAAMDQRLLQALPGYFQGALPVSSQPLALSLFNAWRRRLTSPSCWLLVPEPGRITAMHLRDKQWTLLKTLPAAGNESMHERLLRETRLVGLGDVADTVVYSPVKSADVMHLDAGWRYDPNIAAANPFYLLGGRA